MGALVPLWHVSGAAGPGLMPRTCDTADGVKDGVIENPLACHFDPSIPLCKTGESDSAQATY